MSATIKVVGIEATMFDNAYLWFSKNKDLEDFLNGLLNPNGPLPYDINPPLTAAKDMVAKLGARIIRFD